MVSSTSIARAALEQPLADAAEELERASGRVAEVQTPWLVDPLSSGVADFADEVEETLPDAELAIDVHWWLGAVRR